MGAWGLQSFENDDALDWLAELADSADLSVLKAALEFEEDYIEAPEACNALAAAEVVLALLGKPRVGLPKEAREWVAQNPLDAKPLVNLAIHALTLVLGENSELKELREESDKLDLWQRDVHDLLSRLKAGE
jgi:hypothetical protein